jgi:hypothetical protein
VAQTKIGNDGCTFRQGHKIVSSAWKCISDIALNGIKSCTVLRLGHKLMFLEREPALAAYLFLQLSRLTTLLSLGLLTHKLP